MTPPDKAAPVKRDGGWLWVRYSKRDPWYIRRRADGRPIRIVT